jgi:hypothetical protein
MLYQGLKNIPVVPVSRPILFFYAHPIIFFNTIDRATLFSPGGCGLLVQRANLNGVCCHNTNYWAKLPKFVRRKYASLVNIDVGTPLKIAQQKNAKTMKTFFYFRPTYPNFFAIWNRNHRFFLGPMRKTTLYVAEVRLLAPSVNPL